MNNRSRKFYNQKIMEYTILLMMLFLLSACAQLTHSDVAKFRKGMSPEEVTAIAQVQPLFILNLEEIDAPNQIEVLVFEFSSGGVNTNYLVSFRNQELIFWGYANEYARSSNVILNKIGQESVIAIKASNPWEY